MPHGRDCLSHSIRITIVFALLCWAAVGSSARASELDLTVTTGDGGVELRDGGTLYVVEGDTTTCEAVATLTGDETGYFQLSCPDSSLLADLESSGLTGSFDKVDLEHTTEGVLTRTLTIHPGLEHAGEYDFRIRSTFQAPQPDKDAWLTEEIAFTIVVEDSESDCFHDRPALEPEPEFTAGTANELLYVPDCEAYDHQLCVVDLAEPDVVLGCWDPPLDKTTFLSAHVEGLVDGHTYEYYVRAYDSSGAVHSQSLPTRSTQDDSPPDRVEWIEALPDSAGVIHVSWTGVVDRVSGLDHYRLQRLDVESGDGWRNVFDVPAGGDPTGTVTVDDDVFSGTGMLEDHDYRFRIAAVDGVGNESYGVESEIVRADATAPPAPVVTIDGMVGDDPYFARGTDLYVSAVSDGEGVAAAHFLEFEAARDDAGHLETHYLEWLSYFTSGWTPYAAGGTTHRFAFMPKTGDPSMVNGHPYYVRVRARDEVGNVSAWTPPAPADITPVTMDCEPPSDVVNLRGELRWDDDYYVRLHWEPATDLVSGVHLQHVWRRFEGGQPEHVVLLGADAVEFTERPDFTRGVIAYWVVAEDLTGNVHEHVPEDCEAVLLYRPEPDLIVETLRVVNGRTVADGSSVLFDAAEVDEGAMPVDELVLTLEGPAGTVEHVLDVRDDLPVRLNLVPDGAYAASARYVFFDGYEGEACDAIPFLVDTSPPGPVVALEIVDLGCGDAMAVDRDPRCGTAFALEWSPPEDAGVGLQGYEVWMTPPGGAPVRVATVGEPACDVPYDPEDGEPLTSFAAYGFEVRPYDHLGFVRGAGNASATGCCDRPPRVESLTLVDGDELRIAWSWPEPLAPALDDPVGGPQLTAEILVYRSGEVDTTVVTSDGRTVENVYLRAEDFYSIVVRGVPITSTGCGASAWSRPGHFNYGKLPAPEARFLAVPAAAPETSPLVSLYWPYDPDLFGVASFRVAWDCDGATGELETGCRASGRYVVEIPTLCDAADLHVTVTPWDSAGTEGFAWSADVAVRPRFAFLPRVEDLPSGHFREYDLEVALDASSRDQDGVLGDPEAGVTEVEVRASTFMNFPDDSDKTMTTGWTAWADLYRFEGVASAEGDGGLVTRTGEAVYFQARTRHAWPDGTIYTTPWNVEDLGRDLTTAVYDVDPPLGVEAPRFTLAAAVRSRSEHDVDVLLEWDAAVDGQMGAEGVAGYAIRTRGLGPEDFWNYVVEPADPVAGLSYLHEDVAYDDELFVHGRQYQVLPVDAVGNVLPPEGFEGETSGILTIGDGCLPKTPVEVVGVDNTTVSWAWDGPCGYDDGLTFVVQASNLADELGIAGFPLDRELTLQVETVVPGDVFELTYPVMEFQNAGTVSYHVRVQNGAHSSAWSGIVEAGDVGRREEGEAPQGNPDRFALDQNSPNPFNPATEVAFRVPEASRVLLRVFDLRGKVVRTMVDDVVPAGSHAAVWRGVDDRGASVAGGMYFYRLEAPGFVQTRKMILLR